jgi:CheY-like chemotaxis protein
VLTEEACGHLPGGRPGFWVVLAVSDTGVGMDEKTRAHIFEPFFTTKAMGTGLGLATVYGAVTQNDGFVSVESEVGRGSTFRIYLPATSGEIEAADAGMHGGPARGTETILLVEDDALVREMAKRALEHGGFRVLPCSNGPEALSQAERHDVTIDLLLTDVVMPGMDGRELSHRLAANCPGLRVLFTSGYPDRGIVTGGQLEAGLNFLPKPYSPHALAATVRTVLDGPAPPQSQG